MFPPQSTPSKRPKRRVESYRIYKLPYSACSQSSRSSPLSNEKATHGRLVGPTLSTPRGDKYYNQYRPLCEVCPRDRSKVVGTLQGNFDRKLSFIPHIKYLKAKCLKALNLLKVLSHTFMGADPTTILKLYRSLVRIKLDYGSIIYGFNCKHYVCFIQMQCVFEALMCIFKTV